MSQWITDFIENFQYFGVFLLMLLENIFPPIPSEVILPLSGYVVSQGGLSMTGVLFAASLGALAGAFFWYAVGRWLGEKKLERFIVNYGPWLAITVDEYKTTVDFFKKYTGYAVLIGRILPTFRTLISVPAGMVKMNFLVFTAMTALGSVMWSAALIYIGHEFGAHYNQAAQYIDYIANGTMALIILAYLYKLVKFHVLKKGRLVSTQSE